MSASPNSFPLSGMGAFALNSLFTYLVDAETGSGQVGRPTPLSKVWSAALQTSGTWVGTTKRPYRCGATPPLSLRVI